MHPLAPTAVNFEPFGDRVVLSLDYPKEKTEGGIFLDVDTLPPPNTGWVIAMGVGGTMDGGKITKNPHHFLKVGDHVMFKPSEGEAAKLKDSEGNTVYARILFLEDIYGHVDSSSPDVSQ